MVPKPQNNSYSILVDPEADYGKAQHRWPFFKERLLRLIGDSPVYFCSKEMTPADFVDTMVAQSVQSLLIAGDDCTVNQVVNRLMTYEEQVRPTLGVLCASSTGQALFNSIVPKARFMNNTERLEACVSRIHRNNTRRIDLGRVDFLPHSRELEPAYFINLATFGISGHIFERLQQNISAIHSGLALLIASGQSLLSYEPPEVTVRVGSRLMAKKERVFNLFIANGAFGPGGMIIKPKAKLWDHQLHALLLPELSWNDFVLELPKLWLQKRDIDPSLQTSGKSFRLLQGNTKTPLTLSLDLDGMPYPAPPALFSLEKEAIAIYV